MNMFLGFVIEIISLSLFLAFGLGIWTKKGVSNDASKVRRNLSEYTTLSNSEQISDASHITHMRQMAKYGKGERKQHAIRFLKNNNQEQ